MSLRPMCLSGHNSEQTPQLWPNDMRFGRNRSMDCLDSHEEHDPQKCILDVSPSRRVHMPS